MISLLRRARRLIRNPEELSATMAKGLAKAYSKRVVLVKIFEDFLQLFRLVKAWVVGEYREVPRATILWAVLAILYFLSPLDAIVDILPGGYLDDIAMISFILSRIKPDLDRFRAWESRKEPLKSEET
jgi:uncharacterized membrane protein YkvA (DUF1232 family)